SNTILAPSPSANEQCDGLTITNCVSNLNNVIGSLGSAATIRSALGLSNWIEVQFNETAPAGSYAGFVVESGIDLLSNVTIQVSDGNDIESVQGSNLLSLGLSGQTKIGFKTTIAFDRIRVTYGGIAGNLDVYYAEVMKFEAAPPLTCNV